MVVFVLFRLVPSVFPPILVVFTLLHPYSHLSCDHICTSPVGTIHLPVHFHRFFTFLSVFQSFNWYFLYYSSRCDQYTHPFSPSADVSIDIPIFHVTIFLLFQVAPSVYRSIFTILVFSIHILVFQWSFLYFSSPCDPYIHLSCGHLCASPASAIHPSIHFHRLCTFTPVF